MSKSTIIKGLNFLARELKNNGLCNNTNPIQNVIQEITLNKTSDTWGYNLSRLVFDQIETPRGTMPNDIQSIRIELNVEVHEKKYNSNEIFNPIIVEHSVGKVKKYNFSFLISGLSNGNKVLSYWHLDFDNSAGDSYIHPDFHLTYGGKGMKSDGDDENQVFGKVMLLPSPRLPYPPMDAILGIDFILRNFVQSNKINNLLNKKEYKNAIKQSQERLWRPYMLSLARHWCRFSGCNFSTDNTLGKQYHPTLID
jgi:hypothetical protein